MRVLKILFSTVVKACIHCPFFSRCPSNISACEFATCKRRSSFKSMNRSCEYKLVSYFKLQSFSEWPFLNAERQGTRPCLRVLHPRPYSANLMLRMSGQSLQKVALAPLPDQIYPCPIATNDLRAAQAPHCYPLHSLSLTRTLTPSPLFSSDSDVYFVLSSCTSHRPPNTIGQQKL